MNLSLPEEFKRDMLFWPVTYAGDAEIFDIEVKDLVGRNSSAAEVQISSTGQGRRRRKSSQSSQHSESGERGDRCETRAVQSPPPDIQTGDSTSCCRQS